MRQTDFVILGLLSEAPLNGYQIKKIIDTRFRFFWNESYGQLYPTLKALAGQGWIEAQREGTLRGRARKVYRLTPQGLAALRDWLQQPVERESVRFAILLKMYFAHLTGPAVIRDHILAFQQAHREDLQVLNQFEKELRAILDRDPDHADVLRVIDFGQKVNAAYLDWCRETLQYLEGRSQA